MKYKNFNIRGKKGEGETLFLKDNLYNAQVF